MSSVGVIVVSSVGVIVVSSVGVIVVSSVGVMSWLSVMYQRFTTCATCTVPPTHKFTLARESLACRSRVMCECINALSSARTLRVPLAHIYGIAGS